MASTLAENFSTTAVFWLMMALLGLLMGGLLLAVLLGRVLGPRGVWGRWLRERPTDHADKRADKVDAWTESGKRLKIDGEEEKK